MSEETNLIVLSSQWDGDHHFITDIDEGSIVIFISILGHSIFLETRFVKKKSTMNET